MTEADETHALPGEIASTTLSDQYSNDLAQKVEEYEIRQMIPPMMIPETLRRVFRPKFLLTSPTYIKPVKRVTSKKITISERFMSREVYRVLCIDSSGNLTIYDTEGIWKRTVDLLQVSDVFVERGNDIVTLYINGECDLCVKLLPSGDAAADEVATIQRLVDVLAFFGSSHLQIKETDDAKKEAVRISKRCKGRVPVISTEILSSRYKQIMHNIEQREWNEAEEAEMEMEEKRGWHQQQDQQQHQLQHKQPSQRKLTPEIFEVRRNTTSLNRQQSIRSSRRRSHRSHDSNRSSSSYGDAENTTSSSSSAHSVTEHSLKTKSDPYGDLIATLSQDIHQNLRLSPIRTTHTDGSEMNPSDFITLLKSHDVEHCKPHTALEEVQPTLSVLSGDTVHRLLVDANIKGAEEREVGFHNALITDQQRCALAEIIQYICNRQARLAAWQTQQSKEEAFLHELRRQREFVV